MNGITTIHVSHRYASLIAFPLMVVNVQDIISSADPSSVRHVKAIILIGGPSRGTTFRPLSLTVPKCVFPVAGKPLISHHIAGLAKVEGMSEVLLIGFYEYGVLKAVVESCQAEYPNIKIRYESAQTLVLFEQYELL